MLQLAKDEKFEFISFEHEFDTQRKDVIWRHDVEFSVDIALKMAEIEHELDIKTTYFFQLHSDYYNIFSPYFTKLLRKISRLGHNIGLHFDSHYYNVDNRAKLEKFIVLDKTYLENVFDVKIKVFSFHNTNKFTLSCEDRKYAELINVYSSFFKNNYNYCADSTGYWRYEILDQVLTDPDVQHLQVLVHDGMWSKVVLSPRKRVLKCIQDNADRIKNQYDTLLPTHPGAINVDD